jgi:hypothetical protein
MGKLLRRRGCNGRKYEQVGRMRYGYEVKSKK